MAKMEDVRKIFEGIDGVNDEHIVSVIKLIHKDTDPLRDKIDSLEEQLEEAGKNTEAQKWEDKYNEEHKEFEKYKQEQAQKESRATKMEHLNELLTDAKFSDEGKKIINAIMEGKIDSIEADESGKIKNASDLIAKLSKDWSAYVTEETKGGSNTDKGNVGGGNGGNSFENMSLTEKMTFANEHPTDPSVTAWLNK